jgi:L-ribulose-5-phosphate 4-epimerase
MHDDLIEGNYEYNTGIQILDCLRKKLVLEEVEMVLIGNHGPFTWGKMLKRPFTTAKF